jgi:DNA modification methylase
MPESVRDRPTKSYEHVFLLSKAERYYWDADAVREEWKASSVKRDRRGYDGTMFGRTRQADLNDERAHGIDGGNGDYSGHNIRDVWTIATEPYPDAHFATFPQKLVELCIKAGSPEGGVVLDPFAGSGTTLAVAQRLGRDSVGIELNPEYCELIEQRTAQMYLEMLT